MGIGALFGGGGEGSGQCISLTTVIAVLLFMINSTV